MIVQPFSYFSQPVPAAVGGVVYAVRNDAFSSSLVLALPFNFFSGSFGMVDHRSDISANIRGTGTNYYFAATGSSPTGTTRADGTTKFTTEGYNTSVANAGIAYPIGMGSTVRGANLNVGTASFVYEGFIRFPAAPTGNGISFLGAYNNFNFTMNQTPSYIRTLVGTAGGADYYTDTATTITKPINTWIHYAFVRSGQALSTYWSGSRVAHNATLLPANTVIGNNTIQTHTGYAGLSLLSASFQDVRWYIGTNKNYTGSTIPAPDSMVIIQ